MLVVMAMIISAMPIMLTVQVSADTDEFVIENGVLTKYNGAGGNVIIPDGVTALGGNLFRDVTNITTITIPQSVTSMWSGVFWGCTGLTSINVDPANKTYYSVDGVLFENGPITLICYPAAKENSSYAIPENVRTVYNGAFWGSVNLTSVTVPANTLGLPSFAFNRCENLTEINVDPENSQYFSAYGIVFNKAQTELLIYPAGRADSSYTIPSSVTDIGDGAFRGSVLETIILPDGVESIGNETFDKCSNLVSIALPDSLVSIGRFAFRDCTALASIIIPNRITSISERMFEGCTSLSSITLADSITSIGNFAFAYTAISSIIIPDSVTQMHGYVFYSCENLFSVVIPENVTTIGYNSFSRCKSLESITFKSATPPELNLGLMPFPDIYVPIGAKSAYQEVPLLSRLNILESCFGEVCGECVVCKPVTKCSYCGNTDCWYDCIEGCFDCGKNYVCENCKPDFVIGQILQSSYDNDRVTIGDAMEILKYLARMDNVISKNGVGSREWNSALITPTSQKANKPAIGDAMEVLKKLAKMDSLLD